MDHEHVHHVNGIYHTGDQEGPEKPECLRSLTRVFLEYGCKRKFGSSFAGWLCNVLKDLQLEPGLNVTLSLTQLLLIMLNYE